MWGVFQLREGKGVPTLNKFFGKEYQGKQLHHHILEVQIC